ncbi:4-oxalomesaconate tautomerase [Hoeflea sp. TYP-13]|uniref:4-oxalomesaconate tautomerase n=1 Tax=Hoeflea sp. TYP-13 TaxID=3230023 RepID=UPI0034C644C6
MRQTAIPFHFLRGGSSRGAYFHRDDLPAQRHVLAKVLTAAFGSGHMLNIDGIGGGASVTTKAAILSPSAEPDIDVDYFFAQVSVEERLVDFKPTCGNILAGVGPAAIEMGIVPVADGETRVRIRAVNTGARVDAVVQTPCGAVRYDGDTSIDGVPGTAAPVRLHFMNIVGDITGALLPTGQAREEIDGIEVTCIDVAMPLCVARAEDFGLTGRETAEELDANHAFYERMEPIRLEAERRMGIGDSPTSVTPKFAVVSAAAGEGDFTARYFTPFHCHPSLAVTGAQCLAACALTPGSVADGLVAAESSPADVVIEHPMGAISVHMEFKRRGSSLDIHSAGLVRTARLIARGELFVPGSVWSSSYQAIKK